MPQRFDSRKQSILDFVQWHDAGELDLSPKFQRRPVWNPRAQSYLMDTIVRGKPIPKIYMRLEVNPRTKKTRREVVDGQQRIRTVLTYVADGFKISSAHNKEFSTKFYSQLDDETKQEILSYEFSVDLLQNMQDSDIYDIFARLNTYSVTLNAQELRHSKFFGDFRTSVSDISSEFARFWTSNNILTDKNILRMRDAEYVADLFIAMSVGIRAGDKGVRDNYYRDWDETFPNREIIESRFRNVIDAIGGIMGNGLTASNLSSTRLFYPFFCTIYHMQYGLPEFNIQRKDITPPNYPKVLSALSRIDDIIEKEKENTKDEENVEYVELESEKIKEPLTQEETVFYKAYSQHWVHVDKRETLTEFMCKLVIQALE